MHEVARLLAPHIRHTPLIPTPGGGFLKLESLQPTGSFKVRGFFAAAHVFDRERVARGLLTVSAGNAALACAYVARELRVPCRVMMVDTAPALKVDGVRELGANAVLMPRDRLLEWIATRAWEHDPEAFIHPFANDAVIDRSLVDRSRDPRRPSRCRASLRAGRWWRPDLRHRAGIRRAQARRPGDRRAVRRISLVAAGVCAQRPALAHARHDRRRNRRALRPGDVRAPALAGRRVGRRARGNRCERRSRAWRPR